MIAFTSPKRTRLLLRIRRLVKGQLLVAKPDWPEEAIDSKVTTDLTGVNSYPNRKLRQLVAALQEQTTV